MFDWWKKVVLKNYANFTGRARRAEYWYFVLTQLIFVLPLYLIAIAGVASESPAFSLLVMGLVMLIAFGTIIPYLAVIVRRLHDLNKSGWNYFVGLIPFVGGIIMLVWLCTDGDRHENNYGPDPKNAYNPEFDFEQRP
jgi:uncharacterized membrane protein YhaH (DUF805 family)